MAVIANTVLGKSDSSKGVIKKIELIIPRDCVRQYMYVLLTWKPEVGGINLQIPIIIQIKNQVTNLPAWIMQVE